MMPNSDELYAKLEGDEKVVLFAIGVLGQPLRTRLKLEKILFLVSKVFGDLSELFQFEKHLYGPYSPRIMAILDDLIVLELVIRVGSAYQLTSLGQKVYRRMKPSPELSQVMEDFKQMLNDLTDDEVMTYIYAFHPDYIAESTMWDSLKPKRKDVAVRLLVKQKITFSKAAELADMEGWAFADYLSKRGIAWRS